MIFTLPLHAHFKNETQALVMTQSLEMIDFGLMDIKYDNARLHLHNYPKPVACITSGSKLLFGTVCRQTFWT